MATPDVMWAVKCRRRIHVDGNASDWVGGEMHGGLIHVNGSAGHLVGSAYRGSATGMTAARFSSTAPRATKWG